MITELVGYVAGILLMCSFLPQVIKTFRVKHADDVSLWMLLITLASALLYEIYSWQLGLVPVFIMNGIFALLVLTEIGLKLHYSRRRRAVSEPS